MSNPAPAIGDHRARARLILEQRGIRPTSQRLKVAEILLTAPRHLTAEQILATLRETSGHVSKATVYNTLNLFVEQGLVREIHADPERCVYDSTMTPHHHFQRLDTGEMVDIRPAEGDEFLEWAPAKSLERWLRRKPQVQGARVPRHEAHKQYAAVTAG